MTTIAITYIGHRTTYRDGACGSGVTFEQGQTLHIPAQYALKMLKHPSVYVRADDVAAESAVVVEAPETTDEDKRTKEFNEQQDMRDSIAQMDKEALKVFAMTHWGMKLNGQKSAENLRAEVTQHFDQFGMA